MTTEDKRTCESTISPNHSDDIVEIWHGTDTPMILCGYHASRTL